ncbi:hypothetical protein [Roseinatronobacter sp.]
MKNAPDMQALIADKTIRARYLDFLKILAIETAQRDHEAAKAGFDTPPD